MIHFDGDALVYLAGFAADSRNGALSHSLHNIKLMINAAMEATNETEYRIFLSSSRPETNFRYDILKSYKGTRAKKCKICIDKGLTGTDISKESYVLRIKTKDGTMKRRAYNCNVCLNPVFSTKPVYYNKIRKYLVERWNAELVNFGEADDWLLIDNPTVVATHDKDIYQGGRVDFYNLRTKEITYVKDKLGDVRIEKSGAKKPTKVLKGHGFKWFCALMLLGDACDNIIKPSKGDGPVFFEKILKPLDSMFECWKMVELYYKFTGNLDKLWDMAKLIWVSRKRGQICSEKVLTDYMKRN